MRYLLLTISLLLTSSQVIGQVPSWQWVKLGASIGFQEGKSAVYDPFSNSAFFTGYLSGTASFSGSTVVSNGDDDVFLARYAPNGQLIWAKNAGSTGKDRAEGICTDKLGNVYLTGFFSNTITFYGAPNITLTSAGLEDMFVAKYDQNGQVQWAVKFGGTGKDIGHSIAYFGGDLYMTGEFENTVNFGTGPSKTAVSGDAIILKMNATNGSTAGGWAKQGSSIRPDIGLGIAVDASGVYVTGTFETNNIAFDNFGPPPTLINSGGHDAFFVCYSLNGSARWASKAGGTGDDIGYSLATDGSNLYAAGSFRNSATWSWSGPGTLSATSSGAEDIFLNKIDRNTGQALWLTREGGTQTDEAYSICIDSLGNPIIAGYFKNLVNFGGITSLSGSNTDIFIAKYNPLGTFSWVKQAVGNSFEYAYGLTTSPDDIYVSGSVRSTTSFDAISVSVQAGLPDIFSAKIGCNAIGGVVAPNNSAICLNASVTLTLTRSFGAIHWQSSPAGMNTWTNILGATLSSIVVLPTSDTEYRAILTNPPCNADTSTIALVTVLPIGTAGCTNTCFLPQGSLIIPMDNTLQAGTPSPFNLKAYGLVNELLQNHIPIRWIINESKAHNGIDQTINAQRIFPAPFTPTSPGPGSNFVLRGGPFAIDSAYVQEALPIITAFANNVTVLRTTLGDSIKQKFELTFSPYVGILNNGGNEQIHIDAMVAAGINPASYIVVNASGVVIDSNTCYTFASEPHWSGTNASETTEIKKFMEGGGNFLAQCDGIQAYENTEYLHTTLGIVIDNRSTANAYYNNGDPFAQFEGNLNAAPTGSIQSFDLAPGSAFRSSTYTVVDKPASGVKVATVRKLTPTLEPGGVCFYLGGHNYNQQPTNLEFNNGLRMYYNAMLVPSKRPTTCNFDFASDVQINKTQLTAQPTMLGDTVRFLVEACAFGPGTAFDVTIQDTLHPFLSYVSYAASNGSYNPTTGQWAISSMEMGVCDSLWITCTIDTFGTAINIAKLTSRHPINVLSNDFDSTHTTLPFPCVSNAGQDTAFCGSFGTLGASTPNLGQGVWHVITGGASLVDSLLDSTAVTGLSVGINLFEWQVTNLFCTTNDTVTVIGMPIPNANAGVDGITCDSSFVLAAASPSAGFGAWTSLQIGQSILDTSLATSAVILQDTGTFFLVWTVTDSICSDSDTMQIYSYPAPYVFAGNDTFVCANQALLNAAFSANSSGIWTSLNGNTNITTPTAFSTTVNNLISGANTFVWTQTSGSCQGTDTVIISYLPADLADAGRDTAFCGSNFTMQANLPFAHSGAFIDPNGLVVFADSSLPNTAITVPDSGSYLLLWIIDNGQCADTASVLLHSDLPVVADAGLDQNICDPTTTLNGTANPLGTGLWSQPLGGTAVFSNPTSGNTLVSQLSGGQNLLIWTVTNGTCQSIDSMLAIHPSTIAIAGPDFALCEFDSASLSANNPSPFIGNWQVFSGPITVDSLSWENSMVTATNPGTMVLIWEVISSTCTTRDTITISVYPTPSANAGPDQTISSATTANLLANAVAAPMVGIWQTNSSANIASPNAAATSVNNLSPGQFEFYWTVSSGPCAPAMDTVVLIVNELVIPNAISPNQDGRNETFFIEGLEAIGIVELHIFNRWGGLVFETSDYKNDWGGKNMQGALLPDDTYYYVLKGSNGFEQTGFILKKSER